MIAWLSARAFTSINRPVESDDDEAAVRRAPRLLPCPGRLMDWLRRSMPIANGLGPGFLAEPLNALSNVGLHRRGAMGGRARTRSAARLAGLASHRARLLIGLGSLAFHTFANRWSVLADVAADHALHLWLSRLSRCAAFSASSWWQGGCWAWRPVPRHLCCRAHHAAGLHERLGAYVPALVASVARVAAAQPAAAIRRSAI